MASMDAGRLAGDALRAGEKFVCLGNLPREKREVQKLNRFEGQKMCRNIKTLFNFDPPATPDEVQAASLQFVRKITGFHKPSKANEIAFSNAIEEIAASATRLLSSLATGAPPRNREEQAAKAKTRAAARFGD